MQITAQVHSLQIFRFVILGPWCMFFIVIKLCDCGAWLVFPMRHHIPLLTQPPRGTRKMADWNDPSDGVGFFTVCGW